MAGNIKGITIQFEGDTTRLDKALRQINNETRSIDKELKQVNNALKFNPTSVELWKQKQELLSRKVAETKTKLDALKQAQAKMDAEGVDKNSAEYKKLEREIIVTTNQVKNFEGQLRKVGNVNLRAASEQVKEVGNKLTAAGEAMKGVSMAAAGVVAGLGAISYKAGQAADDLNTMSKVTGIGTQDLQKYGYAADLVDVSVEAIAKSNKKLSNNAYAAANGSKSQAEAFAKLGVSVTDADGNLRDSDAIFQDTITALGTMKNETERNAIAQKLMGKSASELNPLIEDGGETYKMVSDTLKKYNLDYIDQATLDKANEFNDSLDTMKLIGSVAISQVGSELAATLAPALEKVVGWVGKFAEWLGNLDPAVLTVIGTIAAVVAAIAPVLLVMGKLAFAISSIMNLMAVIGPALGAIAGPIGIVIAIIAAVVAAFVLWKKHGDKIKKFFADFGAKIAEIWNKIKEAVSKAVEAVKTVVTKIFTAIKNFIMKIVQGYVAYVKFQFNLMKTIVTAVINGIKLVITTVFNAIKKFITTVVAGWKFIITTAWNVIKKVVSTAVNGIKTVISTVFTAVKSTVTKVWNGIKTAITTPINAAKNTVSKVVSTIKDKLDGLSGISTKVKTAFDNVKKAITEPIDKAKNAIKDAIDKIKKFFDVQIKLPKFKIPKLVIKGGKIPWGIGGKGTAPSISFSGWYKNGGIFDSPSLIGVGEAGSEAVVPLDRFWKTLEGMNTGETTINIVINGAGDPRAVADEVKRMLIRETNQRRLAWQ